MVPCISTCTRPFILQHQKNGSKFIIHDNRMIITRNFTKIKHERERERGNTKKKKKLGRDHGDEEMAHPALSSPSPPGDYRRT